MDNSKNSTTCVTFCTHKQISSTMKSDSTCTILLCKPLNEVCIKAAQQADLKLEHTLRG